jgi:hypothetical protein
VAQFVKNPENGIDVGFCFAYKSLIKAIADGDEHMIAQMCE